MKPIHQVAATRIVSALAAALLLASCGDNDKTPPPVEETVFGDTVGTTQKARAVEDTVMQQKESIDRSLDEAGAEAAAQ